jgi:glycerol-3-phosphate dehydrogenase (NAD(P)+)
LRVYATNDLVGVELGGAMKNVLAIAAGVCDGLALGANARAALLTRGLAEMSRLGVAIGAQASTFMGLATLGDLILTATGDLSRNRRVGLALAAGERIETILRDLGHVAEGVPTAPALLKLAQAHSVDVPITQSVAQLLSGQCSAKQAIDNLMSREPRDEYAG